jgi:DNA-binding MarR family transcriptional regulator
MDDARLSTIAQVCLARRTQMASRALTRHYNSRLKWLKLTATQFAALVTIGGQEGILILELAEALGTDGTTLTRNVQLLEKRGWVVADGGRGRGGKRLSLTAKGRTALKKALDDWEQVNAELVKKIGAEQARQGLQFLLALENAVGAADKTSD